MNTSVERLKLNKRQVEKNILEAIEALEHEFGIYVSNIQLQKNHTIGCREGKTTGVVIKVEV